MRPLTVSVRFFKLLIHSSSFDKTQLAGITALKSACADPNRRIKSPRRFAPISLTVPLTRRCFLKWLQASDASITGGGGVGPAMIKPKTFWKVGRFVIARFFSLG